MKKLIAFVMVIVVFASMAVFPASAASVDGVDPCASVTRCPECGGNVRYVKHVVGEVYGIIYYAPNECPYAEPGAAHSHDRMRNYDLYRCSDCNFFERVNQNIYEWCADRPGTQIPMP